ncbi:MAG TPA: hypothetical protein VNT25_01345 [Allosphingosinicella sp.]|nr:hypothetical protein [Allosphingosinicella sp.]
MRFAPPVLLALLASLGISASPARAGQASTAGTATIEARVGASVLQDVMAQTNITVTIFGRPGDSVSLGVPGSLNVTNGAGQNLRLITTSSELAYASGVILSEDTVSVSIGAMADRQTPEGIQGSFGGVRVVLAQYN